MRLDGAFAVRGGSLARCRPKANSLPCRSAASRLWGVDQAAGAGRRVVRSAERVVEISRRTARQPGKSWGVVAPCVAPMVDVQQEHRPEIPLDRPQASSNPVQLSAHKTTPSRREPPQSLDKHGADVFTSKAPRLPGQPQGNDAGETLISRPKMIDPGESQVVGNLFRTVPLTSSLRSPLSGGSSRCFHQVLIAQDRREAVELSSKQRANCRRRTGPRAVSP
jgi:hypothetical protein